METIKLSQTLAQKLQANAVISVWELVSKSQLAVNDTVRLVEATDPRRPETWKTVGTARITRVLQKRLSDVTIEELQQQGYQTVAQAIAALQVLEESDVSITSSINVVYLVILQDLTNKNVNLTTNINSNEKITTNKIDKVHLYTDGGSRGNPGPSASGFVVINPTTNTVLVDKGIYLGITTNNQAEYLALKYGLEATKEMGVREVACYLDSMLVVNQMKGIFKVSNRDLWPVHESIKQLVESFKKVTFTHIPRERNTLADAAVNRALDEGLGLGPIQKAS